MGICKMKLKTLALTGASLLCFATPAMAGGDGWYLGLGVGWSKLQDITTSQSTMGAGSISFNNAVRGDIAAGFKWPSGFRLELEDGYASYPVKSAIATTHTTIPGITPGTFAITPHPNSLVAGATGHVSVGTVMFNAAYDFPLTSAFAFTLGAGAGGGRVLALIPMPNRLKPKAATPFPTR